MSIKKDIMQKFGLVINFFYVGSGNMISIEDIIKILKEKKVPDEKINEIDTVTSDEVCSNYDNIEKNSYSLVLFPVIVLELRSMIEIVRYRGSILRRRSLLVLLLRGNLILLRRYLLILLLRSGCRLLYGRSRLSLLSRSLDRSAAGGAESCSVRYLGAAFCTKCHDFVLLFVINRVIPINLLIL